jgi:hypothetical protein
MSYIYKQEKAMKLLDLIKERFRDPTPLEVIGRELAEARLEMLQAETAVDYAESIVMYNKVRIDRLNDHIAKFSGENK